MPPIYVAEMDTEHFSFTAVGRTRDEAVDAMVQTMRRHRAQTEEPGELPAFDEGAYHPYVTRPDFGAVPEDAHPDDIAAMVDAAWLRHLATDYYGVRVSGPLEPGAPGTRDGEPMGL